VEQLITRRGVLSAVGVHRSESRNLPQRPVKCPGFPASRVVGGPSHQSSVIRRCAHEATTERQPVALYWGAC